MSTQAASEPFPADLHAGLSLFSILRQSAKLSAANVVRLAVLFPLDVVVARFLGPVLLGVVGLVQIWQLYASLAKSGVFQAAYRELPPLIAKGEEAAALRIQNLGVTAETAWLAVPASVMLIAGILEPTHQVKVGLMAASVAFLVSQFASFAVGVQYAHQRFGLVARLSVVGAVASAAFVLATIWFRSPLTPILSPAFGSLAMFAALVLFGPPLHFRVVWDWAALKPLLRVGVVLSLGTLAYWGFRIVDRTVVAGRLPLIELGYFTFALNFINLGILFVADFISAAQPRIWTRLAQGEEAVVGRQVRSLTLAVIFVTCVAINVTQSLFGAFVASFVPSFQAAIPVFEMLAFVVLCGTAGVIPAQVLSSSTVNRQGIATLLYAVGIPINLVLALAALALGRGLVGVAAASVLAQGLVAAAMLVAVRRHLFVDRASQVRFYGPAAALVLITGALAIVISRLSGGSETWAVAGQRLIVVVSVWLVVAAIAVVTRKREIAP
jgi:O-antigen/teichoic acid export membrane protein